MADVATSPAQTDQTDDLFSPPAERVRVDYFGEITQVDDWDCVLRRGAGKIKFDPGQHDISEKRVAIKLQLTSTSRDGSMFTIDQDDVNTGSKWRTTLKSLQTLGISSRQQLRALKGQFAHIKRVPTGETYVASQGKRQGEKVQEQAWHFVALYPDAGAAQAAENTFWDEQRANRPASDFKMPDESLPNPPNGATDAETNKIIALKALSMLWKASGHNQDVFKTMLEGNPMVNQHYPFMHPQTIALMSGAIDEDDPTAPF